MNIYDIRTFLSENAGKPPHNAVIPNAVQGDAKKTFYFLESVAVQHYFVQPHSLFF